MMEYESQHIAITRADGGVSIMEIITRAPMSAFAVDVALTNGFQPSQDGEWWEGGITDEGVEMEIKRSGIDSAAWHRIDPAEIPSDRTFREAWMHDGKTITHDLAKAKEIARGRIRAARDFAPLDAQISQLQAKAMLGTLTSDDKMQVAAVEAKRQVLRDAPTNPAIDAAQNVADLAAEIAEATNQISLGVTALTLA